MGERLPCKQEVTSSNLVISTRGETNERVGASRMYLENCIQISISRNDKTSEVNVITFNLNTFEENELKQLTYYQRM